MPNPHRQQIGALGAHVSWSRTPDRAARTAPARKASPADIEYHVARLDPIIFATASEADKMSAAQSARTAYYRNLALRSAAARRSGAA